MTPLAVGGVLFGTLMGFLAIGVPVGIAMLIVGAAGMALMAGWVPMISFLSYGPMEQVSSYALSVIPLFILMGQFAAHAGLSRSLFHAANAWLGHFRGGIAMGSIGACALFGCIAGSSLATIATMARVALPEMRRLNYSGGLSTATLAAGGTLGILIPPSVILIIYATLTEQSIGKLFVAALIPALIATVGYMVVVGIVARLNPEAGPRAERQPLSQRLKVLTEVWHVLAIFALIIIGINVVWFTPTEGAAVGAASTGLLALVRGRLTWDALKETLLETAQLTAMIYLIFIAAEIYNSSLALSQFPQVVTQMIIDANLSPYMVVVVMILIYVVLGCFMDSIAMILLTIPLFFPIVISLDFGMTTEETAIWFGILALMVVEVGLITPPIGMNLYMINALSKDVPIQHTIRSILPFLVSDFVRIVLLVAFPGITLFAVRLMG